MTTTSELDLWDEQVHGLAVVRAMYADRRDLVERLNEGWAVAYWRLRHEWELPSHCVLARGRDRRVYIAGTENSAQSIGHLRGYLGVLYGGGVVNRSWAEVAPRLRDEILGYLPDREDKEAKVLVVGHSYGAALAQVLSDIEADDGRYMENWRVVALASPKPYSSGVKDPKHRVDILRSKNDIVTAYPFNAAPVYFVDPYFGVFPLEAQNQEWQHRGNVQVLDEDGSLRPDDQPGATDSNETFHMSFAAHATRRYLDQLEKRRQVKGWNPTYRSQLARQAFDDAEAGSADDLSRSLRWFPTNPSDPVFWFLSGFSASNGGPTMSNPIECTAHFECKEYGWSESLIFAPESTDDRTFAKAQAAWEKYLSQRVSIFSPEVRYGRHFSVVATNYNRIGLVTEGFPDWTPTITPEGGSPKNEAGSVEPPFVGYLIRMYAGLSNSRTYFLRPLPNIKYMDGTGEKDTWVSLQDAVQIWFNSLTAANCWAIQAIKKDVPKKTVLGVETGPLAAGLCDLVIPAHGYLKGQEISLTGGPKERKNLRGRHYVYAVPNSDTVRLMVGVAVAAGTGGLLSQGVEYHYPLIKTYSNLRVSKRDTGSPIAVAHGSR